MKAEKIALRVQQMKVASDKLKAKIAAGHRNADQYAKRLAEYADELEILELEGKVAKLRASRKGDVVVSPPSAELGAKGGGD